MADHRINLRVQCYAGYRGEETPERLCLGNRQIGVREVLDRWLDPDYRYFKLRAADDGVYVIRHDMESGRWDLVLFDSGALDETRLSST